MPASLYIFLLFKLIISYTTLRRDFIHRSDHSHNDCVRWTWLKNYPLL